MGCQSFHLVHCNPSVKSIGYYVGSSSDALSMAAVLDEQQEFDIMIGRALDR